MTRPQQKQLEQAQLAARKIERHAVDLRQPPDGVERQPPAAKHRTFPADSPPDQGSGSRLQLGERKGFAKVVVRALVEPFDPLFHRLARSQDQHRNPRLPTADSPEHLEPVHVRQSQIENHQIIGLGVQSRVGIVAPRGAVHRVTLGSKQLG